MSYLGEFVAAVGVFAIGYVVGSVAMATEVKGACKTCKIRVKAEKQGKNES